MRPLKKKEKDALEQAKVRGYLIQDLGVGYEAVRHHRKWCEQNCAPVASIRGRGKKRQIWFEVDKVPHGCQWDCYLVDKEEAHRYLVDLSNLYSTAWYGGAGFPCFIVFDIPAECAEELLLEVMQYRQQIFCHRV